MDNVSKTVECEAQLSISPRFMKNPPQVIKLKAWIKSRQGQFRKFEPEVDNGCQITCIHPRVVKRINLREIKLKQPIPMSNADGSANRQKEATHVAEMILKIGNHEERLEALILDIGENQMLLGQDWLQKHNPTINWKSQKVELDRCPTTCGNRVKQIQKQGKETKAEIDENGLTKGVMPNYIHPFKHLFEKKNFDKLPKRREWDHEINLVSDAPKEIPAKNYRMTPIEEQHLDKFIDEELKAGKIRPSKSPYASPCFFIFKKDKTRRLVQDYRKINSYTIKDKTPLPRIDDLLDVLAKGKWFNKADIIWGYNNVRIKEGHEHKAAFLTTRGLFEPLVMYFGLCNSPGTFMRMMATIFRDMIRDHKCIVYMDDIVFLGQTKEELRRNTEEGLKILEEHELYVKASKCYWEVQEVPILGHIVGNGNIRMEPAKTKVILDWKEPTCKKDVQKFNGFCNFYRRYVKGYSRIAKPFTRLMGDTPFQWGAEERKAFEEVKKRIASKEVITLPTPHDKYRVEVDASGYAIGGVLSQKQNDKWRTVAFISRTMSPAELNYDIYDKELLAIIYALEEWRPYLLDAEEPFEIWTDHKNLSYFRKPQRLNSRQARWYLKLQDYNFELKHIPGKTNSRADILSRLPWYKEEIPKQEDHIMLDETKFVKQITSAITMFEDEQVWEEGENENNNTIKQITEVKTTIKERIKQCKQRETTVIKKQKEKPETFEEKEGILYHEGKAYIPPDIKLREMILYDNHDAPIAGHPGIFKTEELIRRQYWWPTLGSDVKKYVKGCDSCQRNKASRQSKATELHPHEVPTTPWESISLDIIGPVPESRGYNAILAVIDRFSKMIRLIPTTTELSSSKLVEIYRDQIWKLHGIPKKITSDRGPQFASQLMKDLCKALGIKQNLSTAYHPQTDGQVERSHQETETFLRHYIDYLQDDWVEWLALAEFQYNDKVHSATNYTPFYLNYGRHPWKGEIRSSDEGNLTVNQFTNNLEKVREDAAAAIRKAQEKMASHYNARHRSPTKIAINQKVWLEATNIKDTRPTKKLSAKRYGPFKVIARVGETSYKLELPESWRLIHPVFHETLLTPYESPTFSNQKKTPPPPPEVIGNELEYEVEKILDSRRRKRGRSYQIEFLIKWKGYDSEHNSWEKKSDIHAPELMAQFRKKYPLKVY